VRQKKEVKMFGSGENKKSDRDLRYLNSGVVQQQTRLAVYAAHSWLAREGHGYFSTFLQLVILSIYAMIVIDADIGTGETSLHSSRQYGLMLTLKENRVFKSTFDRRDEKVLVIHYAATP
jgi:hypothetical protein